MSDVHNFVLFNDREIEGLTNNIEIIVKEWADDWLAGTLESSNIKCNTKTMLPALHEWLVCKSDNGSLAIQLTDTLLQNTCELVFNELPEKPVPSNSLVYSVLVDSLYSLLEKIYQSFHIKPRDSLITGKNRIKKGAEHLLLQLEVKKMKLDLIIDKSLVKNVQISVSPDLLSGLASYRKMLGMYKGQISIGMPDIEITVDELMRLQVGDVVDINLRAGAPLELKDNHGKLMASGLLGVVGGRKAIKLLERRNA